MDLHVDKERIIDGLQKAAAIIPSKSGAAYLRSIWLKAENNTLSLMSTDANLEFTGTYPADVIKDGLIGTQGRALVDLVRQLPAGKLHLSMDEGGKNLLIQQGKRKYTLSASGPEWFQNFSEFPQENTVTWSGEILQSILDRVSFCIGDDDAQEAIACLYFKPCGDSKIEACGLNGHQFALISILNEELHNRLPEKGLLIQKKYLNDIKKWISPDDIELNFTEKRIYLRKVDNTETLSFPRSLHNYPDYTVFMSKFTPDVVSKLVAGRQDLIESLGRIAVFNTDNDRCVLMDLGKNELSLSAQGSDVGSGKEIIDASYDGDIERIAFPTKNMMEICGHFISPNLDIEFTGTEGPCSLQGAEDGDYIVIIMPMKIAVKEYYTEEEI